MIVDARGDLCTGTALARDLVLTAAHCVTRPIDYQVKVYQTGQSIPVRSVARHPRFDCAQLYYQPRQPPTCAQPLASGLPDIRECSAMLAPPAASRG